MTIPSTTFSLLDHFLLDSNRLIAYNHKQLLIVELDHEAKPQGEGIFGMKQELHDEMKI